MDGTLVDTEPYWIDAEYRLVERHGGTWTEAHSLNLVGNDLLDSGRYIREHGPVDLTPEQIVEELLDDVVRQIEVAVPWRPGARELLAEAGAAGVPCALVTMSYQRFVEPILAELPDGTFTEVVTGDSVSHGKPHPEPYLKAAKLLGVAPGGLPGHRGLRPGHHQRRRCRLPGAGHPQPRPGQHRRAPHPPRHAGGPDAGRPPRPGSLSSRV